MVSALVLASLVLMTAACGSGGEAAVPAITTTAPDPLPAARAALVQGEDAAIYAYSIAGARVKATGRARAALAEHRAARDAVAANLPSPIEPSPAYSLAPDPQTPNQARTLLAQVESGLVPLYAALASAATGDERARAQAAGRACAARAAAWQASPPSAPAADPSPAAG